ncbi:MAG: methyltransferase domain-containing protein, partial [Solirubrobacteraceae bacterium]
MACGPGIISRALAPHVREVHGVDLTPAMVA